ncbi:hypothetical protein LCGC14_0940900 [marine sediment metagenome]|uniref:Schlafen AlbA-2 domain-containing protein n=1 Tax=marine sediment metagenome TaxID=412755 RepID=A0A0F9RRF8_9ZZZZ
MWYQLNRAPTEYAIEFKAKTTGVISNNGEEILIAIDNKDNFRHLIIPIKKGNYKDDTSSRGINILYRSFKKEGEDFQFINTVCKIPRLNELFNIIISEILEELKSDNTTPYKVCIKILQQWRELINRKYYRLLPEHEIQGLFGELWYLRELYDFNNDALKYWQGPQGHPHDFSNGTNEIEVKTYVRKERIIRINGIDQLTPPMEGLLYLSVIQLKKVTSGGESVPNLIDSLRDKGVNYTELLAKISEIGYSINDNEQYDEKYRYQVSDYRTYNADNKFPKITLKSFKTDKLPQNVIDLNYTLNINSEPPKPIIESNIKQVMIEFCSHFSSHLAKEAVEKDNELNSLKEKIAEGENKFIEFKSSLRWDYNQDKLNKELEFVIVKTITAFLNTEGGVLFIGVDDNGNILGIKKDYETLGRKQNKDGFLLKLDTLVNNHIGKEIGQYINIKIIEFEDKHVCVIEVSRSGKPLFFKRGNHEEFIIRGAAGTKTLSLSEYTNYRESHWSGLE